jgi:hypothetical protein
MGNFGVFLVLDVGEIVLMVRYGCVTLLDLDGELRDTLALGFVGEFYLSSLQLDLTKL